MRTPEVCPFCRIDPKSIVMESEHGLALLDRFPVSRDHTLVVSRRHVRGLFDLTEEVQADLWGLVSRVRADILRRRHPEGFTIGVNDGIAAGQTVGHAHIHLIPRCSGDVPDPRGGVRWVLPGRAAYWDLPEGEEG